jgi:hypothetical protein
MGRLALTVRPATDTKPIKTQAKEHMVNDADRSEDHYDFQDLRYPAGFNFRFELYYRA